MWIMSQLNLRFGILLVKVYFFFMILIIVERYRSLAPMYYRGAGAAIVVYDITSRVRSIVLLFL